MASLVITEVESGTYKIDQDSSVTLPTEGDWEMHMGRGIGRNGQLLASLRRVLKQAEETNYEQNYVTGSHMTR